jgi:hypothetical protein
MRIALFWTITQRVVVTPYRHFVITSWSYLQGSRIQERLIIIVGRVGKCSSWVLHRGKAAIHNCRTGRQRENIHKKQNKAKRKEE